MFCCPLGEGHSNGFVIISQQLRFKRKKMFYCILQASFCFLIEASTDIRLWQLYELLMKVRLSLEKVNKCVSPRRAWFPWTRTTKLWSWRSTLYSVEGGNLMMRIFRLYVSNKRAMQYVNLEFRGYVTTKFLS